MPSQGRSRSLLRTSLPSARTAQRARQRRGAPGRGGPDRGRAARPSVRTLLLLSLCLLAAPEVAALPLTFDPSEIGGTALPANSVGSVMGVSFEFTIGGVGSTDAIYGAMPTELLGDVTDFVTPGVLEGDSTGILTLDFDSPVASFSFGLAMDDSFATQANPVKGFDIELFDALGQSLGPPTDVLIFIQPTGGNLWAETLYSHAGGTPVKSAVLDFNEGTFPDRTVFWFDNLDFATVPEPGTFLMLGGGLVALARSGRIRRR